MKSVTVKQIQKMRLSGKRYHEIARLLGLTELQVRGVLDRKELAVGPDDLIDGERLEDRVKRLKAEIRAGVTVVERDRNPQYYIVVPEGLK